MKNSEVTNLSNSQDIKKALYDSERNFKLMIEAVQDYAIFMLDPDGRIATWNEGAKRIKGYTADEIIGKHFSIFYSEKDRTAKKPELELEEAVRKGRVHDEGWRIRKDGTRFWAYVVITALRNEDGKLVGFAKVTRDATERIYSEELEKRVTERTALAERRAQKLQELAAMLTVTEQRERQRIAQILHDHLQQILVAARIGINRLHHQLTSSVLKMDVEHIETLLEESINATRSLTVELNPPILKDAGLLAALEWLKRWMRDKHALEVQIITYGHLRNPSEERSIIIFQAVRELLFNVVKHSGVNLAVVQVMEEDKNLHVTVEDQGVGFDAPLLHYGKNIHYGLISVRERLEMLGCQMIIESEPGKGSRFTVIAPIQEEAGSIQTEAVRAPLTPIEQTNGNHKAKILVVDDHKILRQGLIHALQDYSDLIIVGEASNGKEAIQKATDLNPNIVIMDISMPEMSGIEATKRIKELNPKIHVIGLSLHDTQDMLSTMMEAGASTYLSKSAPIDELIFSIRHILSGKK